jgi:hypothetical protein
VTDRYARFLLDEIIPGVAKTYNLRTTATAVRSAGPAS